MFPSQPPPATGRLFRPVLLAVAVGVGHVLVADAVKARQALQSAGAVVTGEQEVLVLDIEDKPGALGKVTRKIADAGVSLNAVYLATKTRVVIGARDLQKARAAVGEGAASRQ